MFPKSSEFIVHVHLVSRLHGAFLFKGGGGRTWKGKGTTICVSHSDGNLISCILGFFGSLAVRKSNTEGWHSG